MTESTKKPAAPVTTEAKKTSDGLSIKECIFESAAYYKTKSEGRRVLVVSAALELIARKAAGPTPTNLEAELKLLSKYADYIQAATKLK
ncbi:hypothetical protein [Pseudomonas sp. NPDC087690]|jgi:hypothetical protein|uniref:hypothetical protein n=1 Tax=Pseudomonas sp. NPDC087690 TaxID=3364446 RepID=UPI00381BF8AD